MEAFVETEKKEEKVCTCSLPLGIATVPCQKWDNTYDLCKALKEGTIFPELNLPFYCGGEEDVK